MDVLTATCVLRVCMSTESLDRIYTFIPCAGRRIIRTDLQYNRRVLIWSGNGVPVSASHRFHDDDKKTRYGDEFGCMANMSAIPVEVNPMKVSGIPRIVSS